MKNSSWAEALFLLFFSTANPFVYELRTLQMKRGGKQPVEIELMSDIHNRSRELNCPHLKALSDLIKKMSANDLFIVEDIHSCSATTEQVFKDILDREPGQDYAQTLRNFIDQESSGWSDGICLQKDKVVNYCPLNKIYAFGKKKDKDFINVDDRLLFWLTKAWPADTQKAYGITTRVLARLLEQTVQTLKRQHNNILYLVDSPCSRQERKLHGLVRDYYLENLKSYVLLLEHLSEDLKLRDQSIQAYQNNLDKRIDRSRTKKHSELDRLETYQATLTELDEFYNQVVNYNALYEIAYGLKSKNNIYVYLGGYHADEIYNVLKKADVETIKHYGVPLESFSEQIAEHESLVKASTQQELVKATNRSPLAPIDATAIQSL
jgi:hypothetical protein